VAADLLAHYPEQFLQSPEVASFCVPIGLRRDVPAEQQRFQGLILSVQRNLQTRLAALCADLGRHLLLDRGTIDALAYLHPDATELADESALAALRDWYDVVIHLRSMAVDFPDSYATDDSNHRNEEVEVAAALDRRLSQLWSPHACYYSINCSPDDIAGKFQAVREIVERHTSAVTTHRSGNGTAA